MNTIISPFSNCLELDVLFRHFQPKSTIPYFTAFNGTEYATHELVINNNPKIFYIPLQFWFINNEPGTIYLNLYNESGLLILHEYPLVNGQTYNFCDSTGNSANPNIRFLPFTHMTLMLINVASKVNFIGYKIILP